MDRGNKIPSDERLLTSYETVGDFVQLGSLLMGVGGSVSEIRSRIEIIRLLEM